MLGREDGREDDLVDHPDDEGLVGLLAEDELVVQDDAGQRVRHEVEVDVVAQLAALAGALEERRGRRRSAGR